MRGSQLFTIFDFVRGGSGGGSADARDLTEREVREIGSLRTSGFILIHSFEYQFFKNSTGAVAASLISNPAQLVASPGWCLVITINTAGLSFLL
jgi:hypothetical protein